LEITGRKAELSLIIGGKGGGKRQLTIYFPRPRLTFPRVGNFKNKAFEKKNQRRLLYFD